VGLGETGSEGGKEASRVSSSSCGEGSSRRTLNERRHSHERKQNDNNRLCRKGWN